VVRGLSKAEPRPDAIDVWGKNRIRSRLEAVSREPETSPSRLVDKLVRFVALSNPYFNVYRGVRLSSEGVGVGSVPVLLFRKTTTRG